jgi:hypothetical protein
MAGMGEVVYSDVKMAEGGRRRGLGCGLAPAGGVSGLSPSHIHTGMEDLPLCGIRI